MSGTSTNSPTPAPGSIAVGAPVHQSRQRWGAGSLVDDGMVANQRPERRVRSIGWWLRDNNGRVIVAQWPSPALWVWIVAALLTWTAALAAHEVAVTGIGRGALIVWALDELVRGVNPFRRLLGAAVLAVQLARFA